MATICPTITVETKADLDRQLSNIESFAARVHVDIADGTMTPRRLLNVDELTLPPKISYDFHIMSKQPAAIVEKSIKIKPNLVIIHAEAEGDFLNVMDKLHFEGVKVGIALLQQTSASIILPVIKQIDHVLVFSGNLGYQGGSFADLALINKVKWLRQMNSEIEIGWDGGVNDINVSSLVDAGVDVINVGGYIQRSDDPSNAYDKLKEVLKK
jgi:ribulose-phosphate 3-epimerase